MTSLEDQLRLLHLAETQREKDRILWEILEMVVETIDCIAKILSNHLEEHDG